MPQGKRIVLASRPVGEPKLTDFRVEEYPVPASRDGQVLLRTIWLSLDPYMRGRKSVIRPPMPRRSGSAE